MKKTTLILLLTALCLLLCSCHSGSGVTVNFGSYTYSDADRYTAGGGRIPGSASNIEINWLDGNVNIAYHDSDEIVLSETSPYRLSEESELHWLLDGTTLQVQYAASGFRTLSGLDKQLTVLLPDSLRPESIRVASASADVQTDGLTAGAFSIDTASGNADLRIASVDQLVINTVSGKVDMDCEQMNELIVDTVSAGLNLRLARTPDRIDVNAVSGSVTISLPDGAGFTADVSTVSGDVSGSLPTKHHGSQYTSGDGRCRIQISTVSGNIRFDALTD